MMRFLRALALGVCCVSLLHGAEKDFESTLQVTKRFNGDVAKTMFPDEMPLVITETQGFSSRGFGIPVPPSGHLETLLEELQKLVPSDKNRNKKRVAIQNKDTFIKIFAGLYRFCMDTNQLHVRTSLENLKIATSDDSHPEKGITISPYFHLVVDLQACLDAYFPLVTNARDRFGTLISHKENQKLFWFHHHGHFYVVPEEEKKCIYQKTALWAPSQQEFITFLYERGHLIEASGILVSYRFYEGKNHTKISYHCGAKAQKPFFGSSLKRAQINNDTFGKSIWQSFFTQRETRVQQHFIPLDTFYASDQNFSDFLGDEHGFDTFIALLMEQCGEEKASSSSEETESERSTGLESLSKRMSPERSDDPAEETPRQPREQNKNTPLTTTPEDPEKKAHIHPSPTKGTQSKKGSKKKRHTFQPRPYISLEKKETYEPTPESIKIDAPTPDHTPMKWRDFWSFINAFVRSLEPQNRPRVRVNKSSHYTFSADDMPSVTIAKPGKHKDGVDKKGVANLHDWLITLVKKQGGFEDL
ncbi:hypothetical protein [Candidatus Hepatobacter penaei]|uniref:hypothetical protein n=1 Tax=Candidatus Hepatobacter penaei TaxID=1274402 RepID=UPI001093878B|nr:hypothetical protein [Candidatus Hepatobacter penaei]TGW14911.1 hypothetical protein EIL50_03150 [bacterium NHP-B]